MDEKFTPEQCLALINGIRDYELLYNPTDKLYKSRPNREIAWIKISNMVGKPAHHCKKKWRHLRDHYIRGGLKRGNSIENWCYYRPLNFLEVVKAKKQRETENDDDEDDVFSETEEAIQPKRLKREENEPTEIYVNNRTEGLIPVKIVTEEYSAGEINVDDSINSDDTEEFMAEITKRIKRLPPNLKDLAKVNILAHITELELQQSAQYR